MSSRFHKYKAKPVRLPSGEFFASKAEYAHAQKLELLCRAGNIVELQRQPSYPLVVNGHLICTYVADFRYREGDRIIVDDVKGFSTREFKIKAKLFRALYPDLELRITKRGK